MAHGPGISQPFARARAIGGLFLFLLVGILAVIDALSDSYSFELGPMGLMLGTGTILLGVNVAKTFVERIVSNGD